MLSPDERARVISAMRRGGSFVQALAEAWSRADPENCRRIEATWPEYIAAYSRPLVSRPARVSEAA